MTDENTTKTDTMSGIKPPVGYIPSTHPLLPPSQGMHFFQVDLLVGGPASSNHQRLLPFRQVPSAFGNTTVDTDYYAVTEGLQFSIRVQLARPVEAGSLYGARVYVDSSSVGRDKVYTQWSESGDAEDEGDEDVDDDKSHKTRASVASGAASVASSMIKEEDDKETVDFSKADHYFWMPQGTTEHVIKGFYKSPTTSHNFVFAEDFFSSSCSVSTKRSHSGAPKRSAHDTAVAALDAAQGSRPKYLGQIRIVFCRVENVKHRTRAEMNRLLKENLAPQHVSSWVDDNDDEDASDEKKIQLLTKPGKSILDGCPLEPKVAILSKDILYERRIIYNSHSGYLGQSGGLSSSVSSILPTDKVHFYMAMPLQVLLDRQVRSQAIMTFHRSLCTARVDHSQWKKIGMGGAVVPSPGASVSSVSAASGGFGDNHMRRRHRGKREKVSKPRAGANDFVRVEDLVHYISSALSPAASFMVCTGKEKIRRVYSEDSSKQKRKLVALEKNYGERHVQRLVRSAPQEGDSLQQLQQQDFADKEMGLVAFFQSRPGTYELVRVRNEETLDFNESPPPGPKNYHVRLAVVDLLSSDEEDSDEE